MSKDKQGKIIGKQKHGVGDIMFFSPYLYVEVAENIVEVADWGQQKVKQMHRLNARSKDGVDWAGHVGVICSDEGNKLHIAHATEVDVPSKKELYRGYLKEPLSKELTRHRQPGEDRSFAYFKPNGEEVLKKIEAYFGPEFVKRHKLTPETVAQQLGEAIGRSGDSKNNAGLEKIEWRYSAGLKAFINIGKLNENRKINLGKQKKQDSRTICSEFAARTLKMGSLDYFKQLYNMAQEDIKGGKVVSKNIKPGVPVERVNIKANQIGGYPQVRSSNTPKAVMHSLVNNSDYTQHYYLGARPIQRIQSILELFLRNALKGQSGSAQLIIDVNNYIETKKEKYGYQILSELPEADKMPNSTKSQYVLVDDGFYFYDANLKKLSEPLITHKHDLLHLKNRLKTDQNGDLIPVSLNFIQDLAKHQVPEIKEGMDERETCMDILNFVVKKTDAFKDQFPNLSNEVVDGIGEGLTIERKDLEHYKKSAELKDPFTTLREKIESEIMRIGKTSNKNSAVKKNLLIKQYVNIVEELNSEIPQKSSMEKSEILFKELTPALKINTGFGIRKTKSFSEVEKAAIALGIDRNTDLKTKYSSMVHTMKADKIVGENMGNLENMAIKSNR